MPLVAALVLFTACAGASPGTATYEIRRFSLESGFITGVVKIPIRPAGPKPVVVRPIVADELLLERGIAVARFGTHWQQLAGLRDAEAEPRSESGPTPESEPEPAPEGEGDAAAKGVGRWLLAAPRASLVGRGYFGLIAAEARQVVPRLLDLLETLPEIDAHRMAIGGSSTTGFVALEAFAEDRRLAVAVVRVACGDYHAFLRGSSLALDGEERWLSDGRLVLEPAYEESLQAQEPIRFAARLPPRPLLLLNGALDPVIPAECAVATARAFEAAYADAGASDRFRFVLLEDRQHELGPRAGPEILAWWQRWLQGDPPAEEGR